MLKATLEEAVVSNFPTYINSPEVAAHAETTLKVLRELGVKDKQNLTVFNKSTLWIPHELMI